MALVRGTIRCKANILRGADCRAWIKNQTARRARRAEAAALRAYRDGRAEDAAPREYRVTGWAD